MNDILTLLYLLKEDNMFKTKQADVDVDISQDETRGRTNIAEHEEGKSVCNIVTAAEGTPIIREMLTTLFPGKEDEIEEALEGRELRIATRDYIIETLPEMKERILKIWNKEGAEKVMARAAEIAKQTLENRTKKSESEGR